MTGEATEPLPSSAIPGRHRAAVRAKTPLTALSDAVTSNVGTVGRRTAVIAASSGLVMTCGLPAQAAVGTVDAPSHKDVAVSGQLTTVRVSTVLRVGDGQVDFSRDGFTAQAAPAPAPAPTTRAASRTSTAQPAAATRSARTTTASAAPAPAAASVTATPAVSEVQAVPAASGLLAVAQRYFGVPYRWGGTTPAGFDCSGYTQYVFAQLGVSLPRTAAAQAASGRRVSAAEARPGDLVAFGSGAGVYHIGIYVGGGKMYDAPNSGGTVGEHAIWSSSAWFVRVS